MAGAGRKRKGPAQPGQQQGRKKKPKQEAQQQQQKGKAAAAAARRQAAAEGEGRGRGPGGANTRLPPGGGWGGYRILLALHPCHVMLLPCCCHVAAHVCVHEGPTLPCTSQGDIVPMIYAVRYAGWLYWLAVLRGGCPRCTPFQDCHCLHGGGLPRLAALPARRQQPSS